MDYMYEVENPTKEDIEIMSKGVTYKLPAEGILGNLSYDVMTHWKSLHGFLAFRKMPKTIKIEVEEEKEKVIEPEVIVEEPKIEEKVVVEDKIIKSKVVKSKK